MSNYKKAVDRMIVKGELILDKEENGVKIYKRPVQNLILKNDFLIDGILASTLPASKVADALAKWYEDGNEM